MNLNDAFLVLLALGAIAVLHFLVLVMMTILIAQLGGVP